MVAACRVRAGCRGFDSRTPGQYPSSTIWFRASLSCLLLQVGLRVSLIFSTRWHPGSSGHSTVLDPAIRRDSSYAWASAEVQARPMGFRAFTEALRGVLVQLGEGSDAENFTFKSVLRISTSRGGVSSARRLQHQRLPSLLPAGLSFGKKSTAEWFCPKGKSSVTLGLSFGEKCP